MPDLRVFVPEKVVKKFNSLARKQFPKELYGIILGEKTSPNVFQVEEIYYPDLKNRATENYISISPKWYEEAERYYEDLKILGDIHTHCYENYSIIQRPEPSEADLDNCGALISELSLLNFEIFGICSVTKLKNRKYIRVRFYKVRENVEVIVEK